MRWRSSTPIPRGWSDLLAQHRAVFTFRFAVHAKGGVRLCAQTREGNISPAQMAHSIGRMIETIECPRNLLEFSVGPLSHEIAKRQVAIACRDVKNIGGQFGFGFRWSPARSLPQEDALVLKQLPANGSERLVT